MISPHTPPGTKVVALQKWGSPWMKTHVVRGRVYTVAQILSNMTEGFRWDDGDCFGVMLEECPHQVGEDRRQPKAQWFFPLHIFRRLELPKILTDIAAGAPVDPDAVEEPKRAPAKPVRQPERAEEW